MPLKVKTPFDLDAMVLELRASVQDADPAAKVRSIMDRVFANPQDIADHIPKFADDDVILFEDEDISIWHCRFQPDCAVPPHDHRMSVTIGVYQGVERNCFYKAGEGTDLVQSNAVDMEPGEVLSMGPSAIHSVVCISDQPSCGLHVYLGALTKVERHLYDLNRGEKFLFTDEAYERLTGDT